ncbi:hypothetical protein [Nannocystis exedens]|nr:hypothetical protein [Nannocystis exedens]
MIAPIARAPAVARGIHAAANGEAAATAGASASPARSAAPAPARRGRDRGAASLRRRDRPLSPRRERDMAGDALVIILGRRAIDLLHAGAHGEVAATAGMRLVLATDAPSREQTGLWGQASRRRGGGPVSRRISAAVLV